MTAGRQASGGQVSMWTKMKAKRSIEVVVDDVMMMMMMMLMECQYTWCGTCCVHFVVDRTVLVHVTVMMMVLLWYSTCCLHLFVVVMWYMFLLVCIFLSFCTFLVHISLYISPPLGCVLFLFGRWIVCPLSCWMDLDRAHQRAKEKLAVAFICCASCPSVGTLSLMMMLWCCDCWRWWWCTKALPAQNFICIPKVQKVVIMVIKKNRCVIKRRWCWHVATYSRGYSFCTLTERSCMGIYDGYLQVICMKTVWYN